MKAFQFTLEPVLTLRSREEKLAEDVWVRSLRAQATVVAELAEAHEQFDRVHERLLQDLGTSFHPGDRVVHLTALAHLRERCNALASELQNAAAAVNRAQQQLVNARMRREMIERLRDKKRDKHCAALRASEDALVDDLVMSRFGRERSPR